MMENFFQYAWKKCFQLKINVNLRVSVFFLTWWIRWDNGEVEKLSPWDMEPISDNGR